MRSTEHSTPQPARISTAVLGIAPGLAVAIWITRKDEYFLENFAAYWLPQAAVFGAALLFRATRKALGGIGIAMALYLYLFDIWATESMAWLFYLFSFPGVLIGALLAAVTPTRKPFEVMIAFAWVVLGIGVNLAMFFTGLF
jgi:hypothetical protein